MARTPPNMRDASLCASSHEAYLERLQLPESRLLETDAFLAGSEFTVADVPLGTELARWTCCLENWAQSAARGEMPPPPATPQLPGLARYFRRLQERPAFRDGCLLPELEHHQLESLGSVILPLAGQTE